MLRHRPRPGILHLQTLYQYITLKQKFSMETNKPRASIHVGADKKSFSAQMGNEAERRGWDEKRYQSKNVEPEKNNH